MQTSIFGACPKLLEARINWEGYSRKGIQHKNGADNGDGSLISLVGVAPSRIVGVCASVIFPCTIKSKRSFSSGTGSPSSGKRAVKQSCVCTRQ